MLEVQRRVGAAPTTRGQVGTARRPGPSKQDGEVYECRNQWWNPLKWNAGSNLVDLGRSAVRVRLNAAAGNSVSVLDWPPGGHGEYCGVTVARLQGKSWAPIPSNGKW